MSQAGSVFDSRVGGKRKSDENVVGEPGAKRRTRADHLKEHDGDQCKGAGGGSDLSQYKSVPLTSDMGDNNYGGACPYNPIGDDDDDDDEDYEATEEVRTLSFFVLGVYATPLPLPLSVSPFDTPVRLAANKGRPDRLPRRPHCHAWCSSYHLCG